MRTAHTVLQRRKKISVYHVVSSHSIALDSFPWFLPLSMSACVCICGTMLITVSSNIDLRTAVAHTFHETLSQKHPLRKEEVPAE